MAGEDRAHWARFADEWIAWARKPGHDAFWAYRAQLMSFIGRGTGEALDIGCGEGRVSRTLTACGYRVTAVDPVSRLLDAAIEARSAAHYVVGEAAALPFAGGRFQLVVAYNMLMDVADVPGALREVRRVMRPDGSLAMSIVHPFIDRGRFAGPAADAPFIVADSYFGRRAFANAEERDGLRMHFGGWSQPLEDYAAAVEQAGLAITSIREPVPDLEEGRGHMARWARLPLFLWLKARPLAL